VSDTPLATHSLTVRRTARWSVLGALTLETTDVWIVLHGYGHLVAEFVAGTEWPVAPHRAFVFPEALQRFYIEDSSHPQPHATAPIGATWMTRDARADDIADNHVYLDAVVDAVRGDAPDAAITVLGFSQGGATASRWAAERAAAGDPPRRLILWGSALPPEIDLGASAPIRHVPTTLVVGVRDIWATAERFRAERERVAAAGFPVTMQFFEGGHRMDNATLELLGRPTPAP
jgi:predicted esterase